MREGIKPMLDNIRAEEHNTIPLHLLIKKTYHTRVACKKNQNK